MLLPLPLVQNVRYDCLAWSVDEAAAVCGVSDWKMWGHVRSGDLPLRKVGLRARYNGLGGQPASQVGQADRPCRGRYPKDGEASLAFKVRNRPGG